MRHYIISSFIFCLGCADQVSVLGPDINPLLESLKSHITLSGDHYADLDTIRRFVHDNSTHDITRPFTIQPEDDYAVMYELASRINMGNDKPVFYCGHRAKAFSLIAESLGFTVRIVNAFTSKNGILEGHVFPEVLSPQGRWEILDPDLDLYYINELGERLGVLNLIFESRDQMLTCVHEQGCSRGQTSREGFDVEYLMSLYDAVLIDEGMLLYINTDKLNETEISNQFPNYTTRINMGEKITKEIL